MATVHRFDDSQQVEAQWAPVLDRWLWPHYPIRPATWDEQEQDIDRVLLYPRCALEYKCDRKVRRTGRLFIETVKNVELDRPGWAVTSAAALLLYFAVPDRVLVVRMDVVRAHLPAWSRSCPARTSLNPHYHGLGVCVPVSVVAQVAETVRRVDASSAGALGQVPHASRRFPDETSTFDRASFPRRYGVMV